jgi:hypothetical protein
MKLLEVQLNKVDDVKAIDVGIRPMMLAATVRRYVTTKHHTLGRSTCLKSFENDISHSLGREDIAAHYPSRWRRIQDCAYAP